MTLRWNETDSFSRNVKKWSSNKGLQPSIDKQTKKWRRALIKICLTLWLRWALIYHTDNLNLVNLKIGKGIQYQQLLQHTSLWESGPYYKIARGTSGASCVRRATVLYRSSRHFSNPQPINNTRKGEFLAVWFWPEMLICVSFCTCILAKTCVNDLPWDL